MIPYISSIIIIIIRIIFSPLLILVRPDFRYLSVKKSMYMAKKGIRTASNWLYLKASPKSPCIIAIPILVTPQLGQFSPVISLKAQGTGIWKFIAKKQVKAKRSARPAVFNTFLIRIAIAVLQRNNSIDIWLNKCQRHYSKTEYR